MSARKASVLIHQYFSAYERKDRQALEALLTDNFTFGSPHDPHLDKSAYFERCWPNSRNTDDFRIEQLIEGDNEAFVLYECRPKAGVPFSNAEFFRIENGKVSEVRVFYGSLPKAA
jgi:ketosteroid isomerase-like protein